MLLHWRIRTGACHCTECAGGSLDSETPLIFYEGRAHWQHVALEAVQYPDPSDYKTFKLRHKHFPDRWVVPMGGIRPWGLSDNTMLVFYDEDDHFYRIGFEVRPARPARPARELCGTWKRVPGCPGSVRGGGTAAAGAIIACIHGRGTFLYAPRPERARSMRDLCEISIYAPRPERARASPVRLHTTPSHHPFTPPLHR